MNESLHGHSSGSGATGQTLGQRLTYFIRLSGMRDRSDTLQVDRGVGGGGDSADPLGLSVPFLCRSSRERANSKAGKNPMLR